ncbi:hypothetical protein [Roseovarius sp. M141]|uniref:hypothetical protein n=1 Tax=Roseovarius sp. M141 TaxID=2583806 RepID=UPI0020CDAAC3|nr:hypothetical protein [Roseovarius sp. M141]MCQ0092719.1 hypothetical protein [Roseovarius sp. M141]
MSDASPRPLTKLVALASSLVVAGIAVVALWNYLGGSGGDDPATRTSVISPVQDAVRAAAAHSETCGHRLSSIARVNTAQGGDLDARLAETKDCGAIARRLAVAGYSALDIATGPDDSPLRAEFLDSAGSLLSIYEMQGDDFDLIQDLLQNARADDTPVASLASDINYTLGNSAPDIAAAEGQLARTQAAYRSGG